MARTVDIEYVGDPEILDDVVKYQIASGAIPPESAAVLRGAAMMRSQVVPGVTCRRVDPEWFQTSRPYQWGPEPGTFVQPVLADDVDKILGSSSGHQFRRADDPLKDLVLPQRGLKLVDGVEGASLTDLFPSAAGS